jgi:hypothetical protein
VYEALLNKLIHIFNKNIHHFILQSVQVQRMVKTVPRHVHVTLTNQIHATNRLECVTVNLDGQMRLAQKTSTNVLAIQTYVEQMQIAPTLQDRMIAHVTLDFKGTPVVCAKVRNRCPLCSYSKAFLTS